MLAAKKTTETPDYQLEFDAIPSQQYYETDTLESILEMYGKWQLVETSGGISGEGYAHDFDFLLMKPNRIFGIARNDSLIETGNVEMGYPNSFIALYLKPDNTDDKTANINILNVAHIPFFFCRHINLAPK